MRAHLGTAAHSRLESNKEEEGYLGLLALGAGHLREAAPLVRVPTRTPNPEAHNPKPTTLLKCAAVPRRARI